MHTCYVIDDEMHAVETLSRYIDQAPGLVLAGACCNPLEAIEQLDTSLTADITFVDIDMPQLSGLDVAGLISDRTRVIFTTAFPEYALKAFEKNAADYLLKPISFERFLTSVKKVLATLRPPAPEDNSGHIFIKSEIKGKLVSVNLDEIYYIESIKNYIRLHLKDEKLITYLTLKELEASLPPGKFFRVHKSFIVNAQKIKNLTGSTILLLDLSSIPLGDAFKNEIDNYIRSRLVQSGRNT